MDNKNHGILIRVPRDTDYKFGSASAIPIARHVSDWFPFLPDTENQYSSKVDFLECVTMSAKHPIEANLNYFLSTNQFSDEALNFFNDNGYITNGKFSLSARFNAKMNGTDIEKGQYLNIAADHFRSDGLLPNADWPVNDTMTWEEFYQTIPQELKDKAKKALWFIYPQSQFIGQSDIPLSFLSAPVQIATEVCAGWDSGNIVEKCSGQAIQHATMLYGMGADGTYYDLDQYPPYFQKLAKDYELPMNMQYIVSLKAMNLRKGMRGSNVLKLQEDLQKLGVNISADGKFGNKTEQIVINFQNHNGLDADGIAGTKTLSKIKSLLENTPTSITNLITRVATEEGVPPVLMLAVAKCESGLDPKLVNHNKDSRKTLDRGLFQWNDYYHSEITDAMAFDPETATRFACKAVKAGNLHAFWSASEPNWKKLVPEDILNEYGII